MNATWKDHERRTAAALGGRRLGTTGAANPDVLTSWAAIECKQRKQLPAWLTGALAKVRHQAGADRLGMVVLHEARRHDSLVVLSLADFRAWFCPAEGVSDDLAPETGAKVNAYMGVTEWPKR